MIIRYKNLTLWSGLCISACALLSCGGDDDNDPLNVTGTMTGKLSIYLTDAPIDKAKNVWVSFSGVEIKAKQGEDIHVDFSEPKVIDLLTLQGESSTDLFESQDLVAGEYLYIRLKVNAEEGIMDSYITLNDDSTHSLYVPSGSQTGLKLNNGFTISANGNTAFTIDFDLRKSVVAPGNEATNQDYKLKPSLRIIDNQQVGHLKGRVESQLLQGEACTESSAVYVYEGANVSPDDEGSSGSPITSVAVSSNEANGTHRYEVGFLEEGEYTVALSCQSASDDPEVDDDIVFLSGENVSIIAGQTIEHDWE